MNLFFFTTQFWLLNFPIWITISIFSHLFCNFPHIPGPFSKSDPLGPLRFPWPSVISGWEGTTPEVVAAQGMDVLCRESQRLRLPWCWTIRSLWEAGLSFHEKKTSTEISGWWFFALPLWKIWGIVSWDDFPFPTEWKIKVMFHSSHHQPDILLFQLLTID